MSTLSTVSRKLPIRFLNGLFFVGKAPVMMKRVPLSRSKVIKRLQLEVQLGFTGIIVTHG